MTRVDGVEVDVLDDCETEALLKELVKLELETELEVAELLDEKVGDAEDELLEDTEEIVAEVLACAEEVVEVLVLGNKRKAEATIITITTTTAEINPALAIPIFLLENLLHAIFLRASSAFLKLHIAQAEK